MKWVLFIGFQSKFPHRCKTQRKHLKRREQRRNPGKKTASVQTRQRHLETAGQQAHSRGQGEGSARSCRSFGTRAATAQTVKMKRGFPLHVPGANASVPFNPSPTSIAKPSGSCVLILLNSLATYNRVDYSTRALFNSQPTGNVAFLVCPCLAGGSICSP